MDIERAMCAWVKTETMRLPMQDAPDWISFEVWTTVYFAQQTRVPDDITRRPLDLALAELDAGASDVL